jgi:hypothetical protein
MHYYSMDCGYENNNDPMIAGCQESSLACFHDHQEFGHRGSSYLVSQSKDNMTVKPSR